jgi:hypothetical protein
MKASKSLFVVSANSHDWNGGGSIDITLIARIKHWLFNLLRYRIDAEKIDRRPSQVEEVPRMPVSRILTQQRLHGKLTSCMRISSATRMTM